MEAVGRMVPSSYHKSCCIEGNCFTHVCCPPHPNAGTKNTALLTRTIPARVCNTWEEEAAVVFVISSFFCVITKISPARYKEERSGRHNVCSVVVLHADSWQAENNKWNICWNFLGKIWIPKKLAGEGCDQKKCCWTLVGVFEVLHSFSVFEQCWCCASVSWLMLHFRSHALLLIMNQTYGPSIPTHWGWG